MAENKIQVEIDLTGDANKEFKKLTKSTVDFQKKTTKSLKTGTQAFNVFVGSLASGLAQKALGSITNAAKDLFNTFVVDGVAAAQVQEDAINRLNVALAASGQYSRAASKDLQEYASSLQEVTVFGDEAILETQALIQSLGQLDVEGLKRATSATLDLASALKIDLKAAALLVGKAATGEISSFSRYGLIIQKGATNSETFAKALDAVNKKFGGAAAAQVNTYSGSVAQASNAFGDFTEEIGFAFTQNQAVTNSFNEISNIFKEFAGTALGNKTALKEFVAQGVLLTIDAIFNLTLAFETLRRVTIASIEGIKVSVYGLGAVFSSVTSFILGDIAGQNAAFEEYKALTLEASEKVNEALGGTSSAFQTINDKLLQIRESAAEGYAALIEGAESVIEPNNAAAASIAGLTDDDIKNVEAKLALNAELRKDDAVTNAERIRQNDAAIKIILAKEKKFTIEELKLRNKVAEGEAKLNEQKLQGAGQFFGGLGTLTQTKNKELFEIGKAAAKAEAVVQGALAIQKALASLPPPFNFLAAAGVAVKTGVQIATINRQSLQTGIDEVPPGFNNDTFPANLSTGERVVPSETNQDLKGFLAGGGNRDVLQGILSRLDALTNQVIVNVGGETIVNEVRNQLESGRVLEVESF